MAKEKFKIHKEFLENFEGALLPKEDLISRLKDGTATVHEALMYTLHERGVVIPKEYIEAVRKLDPAKAIQFENIANDFPPSSIEPFQVGTFEKYLKAFSGGGRDLLDEPYFSVTKIENLSQFKTTTGRLVADFSTTLTNVDKYVFGLPDNNAVRYGRGQPLSAKMSGLFKQPRGSRQIPAWPSEKKVYKSLMDGVRKIPDAEIRKAIFLELVYPARPTSHSEMTLNYETSASRMGKNSHIVAAKPYVVKSSDGKISLNMPFEEASDSTTKSIKQGVGKKTVRARVIPGDLLQLILNEQREYIVNAPIETIPNKNYLFSNNVTVQNLSRDIRLYVNPEFLQYKTEMLNREISSIADIRKMSLSSMADSLKMPEEAHLLSGHTLTSTQVQKYQSEMLGKVYVTPYDTGAQSPTNKALILMEHHIANMLGFEDLTTMAGPHGFDIIQDLDIVKAVKIETIKPDTVDISKKLENPVNYKEKILSFEDKTDIDAASMQNEHNRNLASKDQTAKLEESIAKREASTSGYKLKKQEDIKKTNILKTENKDATDKKLKTKNLEAKETDNFIDNMFDDGIDDIVDDGTSNIGHNKPPTKLERTLTGGIERLTNPSTYTNIAENVAEAAVDPDTYKKIGLLALGAVNPFNKLKYIHKAGKMLIPRTKLDASAEASIEGVDTVTRDYRAEQAAIIQAQEMQEQMGDVDYSMEQNESLIGDDRLETTEDRQMREMLSEPGFGA